MTSCAVCEGRTADTFLCRDHTKILRRTLHRLPWWLSALEDAAVGNVRMGDRGRSGTHSSELHGDASTMRVLPGCQCFTDECVCDLEKARDKRQHAVLDWALSTGKVNGKASRLYERVNNDLTTTVRDLCEKRGVEVPKLTTNECAQWLSKHINAIAADPSAKEVYNDAIGWEAQIRKAVNRRPQPIPVGACPDCGLMLVSADRNAPTVSCPRCDLVWDAAEVREWNSANLREMSFTVTELLDLVLPAKGIHVHRRYVQMRVRNLDPTGYSGNAPRYLYADIEKALGEVRRLGA